MRQSSAEETTDRYEALVSRSCAQPNSPGRPRFAPATRRTMDARPPASEHAPQNAGLDGLERQSANSCVLQLSWVHTKKRRFMAPTTAAQVGMACGNGGMCNSAGGCDPPPARCGDGIQQGSEECDAGRGTSECDTTCHRKKLNIACALTSDCQTGQTCESGACLSKCGNVDGALVGCPTAGVVPESGQGDITCTFVNNQWGYCRVRCDNDGQCPLGMKCSPSPTAGLAGTCYPG
jgi:hypothetical protein